MTGNIRICDATPSDAEAIGNILHKTWLATYPNAEFGITVDDIEERFSRIVSEEGIRKRADDLMNLEDTASFLLAMDGDEAVGLCATGINGDNNQLRTLYILPEYQKMGIGRMLWNEALKRFDDGKDIIVQVATYNDNAIGFYKKLGFRETGKLFYDERFDFKSGARIPETELLLKRNSDN